MEGAKLKAVAKNKFSTPFQLINDSHVKSKDSHFIFTSTHTNTFNHGRVQIYHKNIKATLISAIRREMYLGPYQTL